MFDFRGASCFHLGMSNPRIWASLDPFLESGAVLGRIQANAGFLKGLLDFDPYDIYRFYPQSSSESHALSRALAAFAPDLWERGRLQVVDRSELPRRLEREEHHVFHLSDCIVHPGLLAAMRNAHSGKIFPITSVTHSLSYARYGLEMLKHIGPFCTPRDAVVATSRTAATVVRGFFGFLRRGYGLAQDSFPEPSVERIPLGVDLAAFSLPGAEEKKGARQTLGFGAETVFLVLARLCHSSKMDFLPVLRAFHRLALAGRPLAGVRLVLAGWSDEGDWGRRTLEDLARNIGLPLTVVERPSEEAKLALYAASDVFLSPSDNLQETFGLTLLEAQARGLPVIASDFDGYRDLVIHGETGILVPTIGPDITDEVDLAAPMAYDNHTHLQLAQRTAVDVAALAAAIGKLSDGPEARGRMALAARRNAEAYGWESVAGRYVELWESLWARDVSGRPSARHPAAIPYSEVFSGYATLTPGEGVRLALSRLGQAVYRGQDFPLVHAGLAGRISMETVRALLVLARKPLDAAQLGERLAAAVPGLGAEGAQAHVLWCLKHDLLERASE